MKTKLKEQTVVEDATVKHTPGPWEMVPYSMPKEGFAVIIGPKSHGEMLRIGYGGGPPEVRAEDEANARLIAAAPDLLEACNAAIAAIGPTTAIDNPQFERCWRLLNDAVVKAQGQIQ